MFPPALKKGHGKVGKKGHFERTETYVKRALSVRDNKQKSTCHTSTLNLILLLYSLCNLLFSLKLLFPKFPYFRIHIYQRQLRKFRITLIPCLSKERDNHTQDLF